jgi:hypothetical protein
MAKITKPISSKPSTPEVIKQTPARATPIPKVSSAPVAKPKIITQEMIAKRAFEIHCSGKGGSESDNWYRAERELKGI